MRPLEIALLLVGLAAVVWPVRRGGRQALAGTAAFGVLVWLLHLWLERLRWQLAPAYVVIGAMACWRLLRLAEDGPPRRVGRLAGGGVAAGALLLSALLAVALPVPPLPLTDGPLRVGTTSWALAEVERPDPYREGTRQLVAQAWYPTDAEGPAAPWVSDAASFSREVAPQVGLPAVTLRHVALVDSGTVLDAPIAAGEWPVVVYSHGWGGFRTVQSDLAASLASEGIVVIALDHSSGAAVSLFPDGTAIPLDPSANPPVEDVGPLARQQATELLVQTFAEDVATLLDGLSGGDGPALLGTGLQLDRVGLIGHSTGGGAVYRLCLTDDRCAGVLGLDPWVEPVPSTLLAEGVDEPVLSLRSEDWQGNANDGILRRLHEDSDGDEGLYVIPGSTHRDFTLLPFLTPLAQRIGLAGEVDPTELHGAVDAMALSFFRRHLGETEAIQAVPPLILSDP